MSKRVPRTRTHVPVSRSSQPAQPRRITPDDLRGGKDPSANLIRLVIPGFFGKGKPGYLYFSPVPSRYLIELSEATNMAQLARNLVNRLAQTVRNEDGSLLMTADEWSDLPVPRLRDIMTMISNAMTADDDAEPNETSSEENATSTANVNDTGAVSGNG